MLNSFDLQIKCSQQFPSKIKSSDKYSETLHFHFFLLSKATKVVLLFGTNFFAWKCQHFKTTLFLLHFCSAVAYENMVHKNEVCLQSDLEWIVIKAGCKILRSELNYSLWFNGPIIRLRIMQQHSSNLFTPSRSTWLHLFFPIVWCR